MLPLKDDVPARRWPVLTVLLIVVNTMVFLHEVGLGADLEAFILAWGLIPVKYTHSGISRLFSWPELLLPFFSSMFLHGGWTHLIGNMWTLWIFGDNVEDRLGRGRFLILYVAGGVAAALVHVFTNSSSTAPTIGASGAVAAVMGAYFRLYPRAQVLMVIPPFFLGPFFVVPAVLFLGWWFILQFFNGTLSLMAGPQSFGIAWWAHIGGFVFGAFVCRVSKVERFSQRLDLERGDFYR